jgi:cytochrome P450
MIVKLFALDTPRARAHTAGMTSTPPPRHVLEAPSHPDPYPWYSQLAREAPLAFDAGLGLWVAAGADAVREALNHPGLRVRPVSEPVPHALVGTPAGEVFSLLVRMNDGGFHARHRPAVAAAAQRPGLAHVAEAAQAAALDLWRRCDVAALLWQVPVQAMARLAGVVAPALDRTCAWVRDFTQGIAPGADAGAVAAASDAALALMAQGEAEGLDRVTAANRIALMQQSLDATSGLIGNALLAWQARPPADTRLETLRGFIEQVSLRDPAIHNTRRFAAEDLVLAGQHVRQGQAVAVVLASAPGLEFGAGPHQCPGERIAIEIAAAALDALCRQPAFVSRTWKAAGYRPLPNARIPILQS